MAKYLLPLIYVILAFSPSHSYADTTTILCATNRLLKLDMGKKIVVDGYWTVTTGFMPNLPSDNHNIPFILTDDEITWEERSPIFTSPKPDTVMILNRTTLILVMVNRAFTNGPSSENCTMVHKQL